MGFASSRYCLLSCHDYGHVWWNVNISPPLTESRWMCLVVKHRTNCTWLPHHILSVFRKTRQPICVMFSQFKSAWCFCSSQTCSSFMQHPVITDRGREWNGRSQWSDEMCNLIFLVYIVHSSLNLQMLPQAWYVTKVKWTHMYNSHILLFVN